MTGQILRSPVELTTRTLREKPWGNKVSRILAAALDAVDPADVVRNKIKLKSDSLVLPFNLANHPPEHTMLHYTEFPLTGIQNIYILAVGKAALPMALGAREVLGDRFSGGIILTKTLPKDKPENELDDFSIYLGGHPIPTADGQIAAEKIIQEYDNLKEDDLVLILLSGGGSALLSAPADGISLADLQSTNRSLLSCGADIKEINTIRKHISKVKGGRLAKILAPALQITIILSDVIGDPIDMIASGPTVADSTTYKDAIQIIRKYNLRQVLPQTVLDHLARGKSGTISETPKPGDPVFRNQIHGILAGNRHAVSSGLTQATREGIEICWLHNPILGEAKDAGRALSSLLKPPLLDWIPPDRPLCIGGGGETTVTLPQDSPVGKGGRNLELALAAVELLHGVPYAALVTLATDGEDGNTDAAGAVVTGETYQRALDLGLDPAEFLRRHDSYTFFEALDDLLKPGPTQTNVNDLCFLFDFSTHPYE